MDRTTRETRRQSYDAVLPKREKRCRLILETLGAREMTASEITEELVAAGKIPYFNRNYVAPRLPLHAGDGLRESDREQQPPEGPTRGLYVRTPRRLRDVQQSMPAQLPAGRLHRLHPAGRKKAGDQDVAEVVPHAPGKPEGGKRP